MSVERFLSLFNDYPNIIVGKVVEEIGGVYFKILVLFQR